MKVEVWSDVMCPFCYIGKRRFEQALQNFANSEAVTIEWKSFQLNPELETDTETHIDEYLARHKGISLERAQQMNAYVTQMAAEAGLTYNFDQAVVANSFNAHRLSHFAKKHGLGDQMEELLFSAYFTEGKNIDDLQTLQELAAEAGLDAAEAGRVLKTDAFADDVKHDIAEAQYLGIQGVPFFVMNNKYAVSGAQDASVFEQTLQKAFNEWQTDEVKSTLETTGGDSCTIDGNC